MSSRIEIIPDLVDGGYTARVLDLPAYGEGESVAEAVADLQEAVLGYIEAFGVEDALSRLVT